MDILPNKSKINTKISVILETIVDEKKKQWNKIKKNKINLLRHKSMTTTNYVYCMCSSAPSLDKKNDNNPL